MSSDPKKRVQAASQRPANQCCADCGCKLLTSSVWASSTLGVFICINCSGRHRNLGTHITFVRSVGLDSWTDEQATIMESIGNEISNQYWEKNIPADYPRPATEDLEGLTKFTRFKYELAKWADKDSKPPNVLLKEGKKVKKSKVSKMKESQSAAPISPSVTRSSSTNIIDFGSQQQTMSQSNSVDILFGPASNCHQQRSMGTSPVALQTPPQQIFAQQNPVIQQRSSTSQQFNPFAQQQSQPADPRSSIKDMLFQQPAHSQNTTGTSVFRDGSTGSFQPKPRALFNAQNPVTPPNQQIRGGPQAPKARKDAFSGLSPF